MTETMAYNTGAIDRMGSIEEKNTISDFDAEEKKRMFSISSSVVPVEYDNTKINIIDVPGYFDFIGEAEGALRVADAAVIVVDALSGVQVGTEKAFEMLKKADIPALIVINKIERENVDYNKVLQDIDSFLGTKAKPFILPIGEGPELKGYVDIVKMKAYDKDNNEIDIPDDLKDTVDNYRETIMEDVAQTSEELMEKYFEGEELSDEEIAQGIRQGVIDKDIIPVIVASAKQNIGVNNLEDMIVEYLPSPEEIETVTGTNPKDNSEITRKVSTEEPFSAYVFKTIADPYVGKLSIFKVLSGELNDETDLLNVTQDSKEKTNHIYVLRGNKQDEVQSLSAGDIGAYSKLAKTVTGDTLADSRNPIIYEPTELPKPVISIAIEAKSKSDVDKLSTGLHRLMEEDPTIGYERNPETHQTLLSGLGEMHLDIISDKLKSKFGVDVDLLPMRIPYRETITATAEAQGRHKKQSGGAGQFGDVWVKFEPSADMNDEFEFIDKVVGGAVPRNFIPAVEKGLNEAMNSGVLAGYPVTGVKATLYDGSYHAVDSDEMSFKMAANLAYRNGMPKAKPILLEPIYSLKVTVPEEYMGDIMGDLNKKRGRIMGMEPIEGGKQVISAEAPLAELFKYATELRSMTQARGDFEMEFVRYEQAPGMVSEKVIAEAQAEKEKK